MRLIVPKSIILGLHARRANALLLALIAVLGGVTAAHELTPTWPPPPAQTQTPASAEVSPDSLDFGDQVVRKSSSPERVTVTNVGGKPLYVNSVSITGDNWKDFTLRKDTCTGATIAPNKSCIIDVRFTPAATEDRSATLVLKDNAPDSPQNVSLTGNGINSIDVPPFQN